MTTTTPHTANPDTIAKLQRGRDKSVQQKAGDAAAKARDYAADTAQAAGDQAGIAVREMRDGIARTGDRAREFTEQQPLIALAGALAVGVAIGLAVGNRR